MNKRLNLFLLIVVIAGLALRLPNLSHSFYGDETFSVLRDSKTLITESEDRFRPVFFSLLFLWRQIGFDGEIGLRLLPLIFGIAQIIVAYAVGKKLSGESLARVFSILVAVSPMLIEFSQELRMYSMVAFLALLQVWIFLRLREKPRLGNWIAFVAVALTGVYTHLHYWLFIAGFALSFYRERKFIPLKQSVTAWAACVLLYLPNIPNLIRFSQIRAAEYVVNLPSAIPKFLAAAMVGFNYFSLSDQSLGRGLGTSDFTRNIPLLLLAAVPAALLLWGLVSAHRKKPVTQTLWLSHELFTIPILLALAASVVTKQYWLQPKYVIFTVPFLLLLIAESLLAIRQIWIRRAAILLGMCVMAVAFVHFLNPVHFGRRESWRDVVQFAEHHAEPETAFLFLANLHPLLSYYGTDAENTWQLVRVPKERELYPAFRNGLAKRFADQRNIYYLWWDVSQNLNDPRNDVLKVFDEIGQRREVIVYNPRFRLFHWSMKPPAE